MTPAVRGDTGCVALISPEHLLTALLLHSRCLISGASFPLDILRLILCGALLVKLWVLPRYNSIMTLIMEGLDAEVAQLRLVAARFIYVHYWIFEVSIFLFDLMLLLMDLFERLVTP